MATTTITKISSSDSEMVGRIGEKAKKHLE